EICPVDIPLPRQILEHRRHGHRKTVTKRALLQVWSRPGAARAATRLAGPVRRLFPVGPAPPAQRPFRSLVPPGGAAAGRPLTIFASCLVDRIMPEAAKALNRILHAAGHRVEFPEDQWCCGLICSNAGDFDRGARLFERLVSALDGSDGPIVTPSAS